MPKGKRGEASGTPGADDQGDSPQPDDTVGGAMHGHLSRKSVEEGKGAEEEDTVQTLKTITGMEPLWIQQSQNPEVKHAWNAVVSGFTTSTLDVCFGIEPEGFEKRLDDGLALLAEVPKGDPSTFKDTIISGSSLSLLHARMPKKPSKHVVETHFADSLLLTSTWNDSHQLAFENLVSNYLEDTGFTVVDVLQLTFTGAMLSKGKSMFQGQHGTTNSLTRIPGYNSGHNRSSPSSVGSTSATNLVSRQLAHVSRSQNNMRFKRAVHNIPIELHKSFYELASYQAEGFLTRELQLEPSACLELEIYSACQKVVFEICQILCELFSKKGGNWALLLLQNELSPGGEASTATDPRLLFTPLEVCAMCMSKPTSIGARALELVRESMNNDSLDGNVDLLGVLFSTKYNLKSGIFAHFSKFQELVASARSNVEGFDGHDHPATTDQVGLKLTFDRLGQSLRLMKPEDRKEAKSLIDAFRAREVSSFEAALEWASAIEKRGSCLPKPGDSESHVGDSVDQALWAWSDPPPSQEQYIAAGKAVFGYFKQHKKLELLEKVQVFGVTYRLAKSQGRVVQVPDELLRGAPKSVKSAIWLLINTANSKHGSFLPKVADAPLHSDPLPQPQGPTKGKPQPQGPTKGKQQGPSKVRKPKPKSKSPRSPPSTQHGPTGSQDSPGFAGAAQGQADGQFMPQPPIFWGSSPHYVAPQHVLLGNQVLSPAHQQQLLMQQHHLQQMQQQVPQQPQLLQMQPPQQFTQHQQQPLLLPAPPPLVPHEQSPSSTSPDGGLDGTAGLPDEYRSDTGGF